MSVKNSAKNATPTAAFSKSKKYGLSPAKKPTFSNSPIRAFQFIYEFIALWKPSCAENAWFKSSLCGGSMILQNSKNAKIAHNATKEAFLVCMFLSFFVELKKCDYSKIIALLKCEFIKVVADFIHHTLTIHAKIT